MTTVLVSYTTSWDTTFVARRSADHPNYPKANPRSDCNAKKVQGVVVTYRAARDWIGEDRLVFDIFFPGGAQRHVEVAVNVK
ncbi:hypothetical protein EYW49_10125 [Siculibacillus lacustris]|uniref:Uncharacterized protein n=1 Tax=Siculibacillus lacustris TaxID=1549641 RepID=A0A4Q9VRD9_9HYPH|nr:hypothetical protein [Siculibacillus lacustris]TBW37964.1 hypothetical protein EYW49_10125 [Siculibacillus lacustris]